MLPNWMAEFRKWCPELRVVIWGWEGRERKGQEKGGGEGRRLELRTPKGINGFGWELGQGQGEVSELTGCRPGCSQSEYPGGREAG